MAKTTKKNPKSSEKEAQLEAEVKVVEPDEASQAVQNLDEEAEKAMVAEEAAGADSQVPEEVAAINEDNESAGALNDAEAPKKKKSSAKPETKKAVEVKSRRSPKHQSASKQIESGKLYKVAEAIELIKKVSYSKFDGSVELHLKLTKKKAKGSTESSKGTFQLPHGSGKAKKIVVLDEAMIEEIAKSKKIDFDIAIASPDLMLKVGKIAKILGPVGKMPDPKSGTVTDNPKKTIDEINSGKVDYRIDATNNIHQLIGKVSWDADKLAENITAITGSFPSTKIAAAYLSATMSPSIALDLSVK